MTIIITTTSLPPVLTLRDGYLDNLALLGLESVMIGVVAVVHPHDAGGPRYREMELGRGRWNDVAPLVDDRRVEIHNVRWIRP